MRFGRRTIARDEGFALVELMVTMLIIGILLGIAIATYAATTNSANAAACSQNRRSMATAAQVAACAVGSEPPDEIEDLRPYVKNFDRVKVCPLDGTPLVFDAATNQVTCPNHS